eukprot:6461002-Amphidinium_carterae.1
MPCCGSAALITHLNAMAQTWKPSQTRRSERVTVGPDTTAARNKEQNGTMTTSGKPIAIANSSKASWPQMHLVPVSVARVCGSSSGGFCFPEVPKGYSKPKSLGPVQCMASIMLADNPAQWPSM